MPYDEEYISVMGLIDDNTLWVFLLPSSHEAEERHIYDIAFGAGCLLSRGVKYDDIVIVIDNVSITKTAQCFSRFTLPTPNHIYTTSELSALLEYNTHKNAVVFVTGHGSPDGLDAPFPMKPYSVYKMFHTARNMKQAVFFFGQCYAGIFNHMPISSHLGLVDVHCKRITAVGGTGLFPSMSIPITVNSVQWSANVFLSSVYLWILKPRDIDGDNKLSVMDAFKFAAIETNERLREVKLSENVQSIIEQVTLLQSLEKLKTSNNVQDEVRLEIQALQKRLEIRYIEQEPWVLNAQVAMNTVF